MLGHPSIWNKKYFGFLEQCKNVISLQLYMMVVHTELSQFILVPVILTVSRSQQHQTVQTESRITWHVLIWSSLIFICLIQSTCVTITQSVKFLQNVKCKDWIGHIMLGFISYLRGIVKQRLYFLQKALPICFKPCMFVT